MDFYKNKQFNTKKRKYDFLKFKTVNKNEALSGFLIQYMWFTKPDKVTTEL